METSPKKSDTSEKLIPFQLKADSAAPITIEEQLEAYKLIFESIYNGIMVTDAEGIITHFNEPYGQFL
ncbi:MAG: PAS domain-containing protein, partial [Desulfobacterales bacterium]